VNKPILLFCIAPELPWEFFGPAHSRTTQSLLLLPIRGSGGPPEHNMCWCTVGAACCVGSTGELVLWLSKASTHGFGFGQLHAAQPD
jgi:hypothetical protein